MAIEDDETIRLKLDTTQGQDAVKKLSEEVARLQLRDRLSQG